MSGGVPKRISISRTQANTYCKSGGKDKAQGLVLCSGKRSQKAMCNYVMKRTNIPFSKVNIVGGSISKLGDDVIHTFNTSGTHIFSIDILGSDYIGYELEFDTLVVGGGGGGGGANADPSLNANPHASAAGGGAGGDFYTTNNNKIKIKNGMKYQVIVGNGGLGGTGGTFFGELAGSRNGAAGGNSSFFGTTALGGEGGDLGDNNTAGAGQQFGNGGDNPTSGLGGNHSDTAFRYGGGGGGGGFGANGGNATFDATSVPMDASGGIGGFSDASGTSSITGTSTTYGGGGGGGVVWFEQGTHPASFPGLYGAGGYYLTNTPHNLLTVGYNLGVGGVSFYGYQPIAPPVGSVADLSLNILGTDYTIASMLFDGSLNSFSLCLEGSSPPLFVNSFDSISFVSNVPGSVGHTYYTTAATFSEPPLQACWIWDPGYFPADLTYWSDASGTNLDVFLNIAQPQYGIPTNGIRGGGGGGATSSDIEDSTGSPAIQPQLPTAGGNGGDGTVIIRYKDPNKKKRCANGLTI